jgi:hypothetical protein
VGAFTTAENLNFAIMYPEPIALGRPFAIGTEWTYTRVTTAGTFSHSITEVNNNLHVLESYDIDAPEVVRSYAKEPFVIRAIFRGPAGHVFRGAELFVQCLMVGPNGELVKIILQDDGMSPDREPQDGFYTGIHYFVRSAEHRDPRGVWQYFVIAQDINSAQPNMKPEEAATIIGGMVITHQLTIGYERDECKFVPDGHVQII